MDPISLSKRLSAIIDTAIDGILTIDDRGIVETMNVAACALFGYSSSEVIGNNVNMLMPEPDHSQHDGYLKRYAETKEKKIIGNLDSAHQALAVANQHLESKVEQRTMELEETVNKLLSTNQQLEISRMRLEDSLEKEKELGELKSRFVSMASHEFRTPLSTILSSASIISRYTGDNQQDKRVKHVDRIKSAVSNLTGILNDFLSISKLEEGVVTRNFESILLLPLLNEVNSEIEGLLKPGQSVHIKCQENIPLQTDRRILKNILFNLISNAIKYSKENTSIFCEVYRESGSIRIDIIDQGIGIPISEQKHLFTRFFRATNVENIQGTGLGLAIVAEYISLLGGTIKFNSVEGKGSTFSINIPSRES